MCSFLIKNPFFQNQIANNQAMHMKAQAHQNQSNFTGLSGLMSNQGGEFFKNDPLTLLQSGFSDISLNKDSQIVSIHIFLYCHSENSISIFIDFMAVFLIVKF